MKYKVLSLLLVLPLISACNNGGNENTDPVEDFYPTLPEYKNKNEGAIKSDDENVYFDFYEVSDFHGATEYSKDDKRLGIERLSKYFDDKRSENPGGTFVISGGDMWQGSADSNLTRGALVTYAMNVMNFDSMTMGNHEFDWTDKIIKNNKERATFPFLAANIAKKDDGTLPEYLEASKIVTRGDYKIGIIGTIGDNIKNTILASAVEGLDFKDEVSTVQAESAKLREQGCDIVVWSSHNDVGDLKDKATGKDLGVDLIFGGHSHNTEVNELEGIPMLESKDLGRSIPHCQLRLNKSTKEVTAVEGYGCDENPTAKEYEPDADITGIYDQYKEKFIDPVKHKYVCKADGDLGTEQLGNIAVEAMFNKVKKDFGDYAVRASFTNLNGGVRAEMKAGKIYYGDVYTTFPFDNEVVICSVKGKTLKNFINNTSNIARYQDVMTFDGVGDNEECYFITTDFLATNAGFFKGKCTIVVYTKIMLRDAASESMSAMKTVKADNYKTSAKAEFQKLA